MPDPFASLIGDARAFLSTLANNNNRDWFAVNKARFESQLKAPALLLLDQVAYDLGRASGQRLKPKLFRPYRDVRFSKDKTPLQTHLHMMWTIETKRGPDPALFFGIAPDYVRLGGGLMAFDKPGLDTWRQAVDGDFGDRLQRELEGLALQGYLANEPPLKRVPTPFDKAHKHGALLRRKGMAVWRDLNTPELKSPQKAIADLFEVVQPMLKLMANNL